jgi:hypothetical protein
VLASYDVSFDEPTYLATQTKNTDVQNGINNMQKMLRYFKKSGVSLPVLNSLSEQMNPLIEQGLTAGLVQEYLADQAYQTISEVGIPQFLVGWARVFKHWRSQ